MSTDNVHDESEELRIPPGLAVCLYAVYSLLLWITPTVTVILLAVFNKMGTGWGALAIVMVLIVACMTCGGLFMCHIPGFQSKLIVIITIMNVLVGAVLFVTTLTIAIVQERQLTKDYCYGAKQRIKDIIDKCGVV